MPKVNKPLRALKNIKKAIDAGIRKNRDSAVKRRVKKKQRARKLMFK